MFGLVFGCLDLYFRCLELYFWVSGLVFWVSGLVFGMSTLHPPKLRLRVASILQVDIQTKVRKIQDFTKIPGRTKTDWAIETGS